MSLTEAAEERLGEATAVEIAVHRWPGRSVGHVFAKAAGSVDAWRSMEGFCISRLIKKYFIYR